MVSVRGAGNLLGALGLFSALGCGQGPADPEDQSRIVVATVGEASLTRGQLDEHLLQTLGGPQEVAEASAEVKSYLLDQLLEEELILAAATKRGMTISDEEAERYVERGGDKDQVRRVLLQRKFKGDVILSGVSVSEVEIRRFMEENRERLRQPARVVLEMMILDDVAEARRIRETLDAEPERFEELAESNSLAPDPGEPRAYEEEILPETIRDAVATLGSGAISPVVEDPQGIFIVKLIERQPDREPDPIELREQVRRQLLQEKNQLRYTEFVRGLREQARIVVNVDRLDFPYKRTEES